MTQPDSGGPPHGILWPGQPQSSSSTAGATTPIGPGAGGNGAGSNGGPERPGKRRGFIRRRWGRLSRRVKWTAAVVVVGLVFRRAVASVVLMALSATLHFFGISVHLPKIKFGWPWQSITSGTTTNTDIGPWVLQKIEGISKPALGQANFNFFFTHKVSKSLGFLPCWYSSTFYAVGHASATVDLNPGPSWWKRSTGHYKLQVLRSPSGGKPGLAAVTMVLPQPQLPQSVHDVTIDDIPSTPVSTQHSWTYPGLACGVLIRPQFSQSVLYAQAQQIAFYRSAHVPQITRPLISSAETEAAQTIRNNFIQPTLNSLGYTLSAFTIHWARG
jgi:hypothetical protein